MHSRVELYPALTDVELTLPVSGDIAAGFPSPAGDFIEQGIDLNRALIDHPSATFFGRVRGHSMINTGIGDGDLLIIDRSVPARDECIAVCFLDGEFTVKRLKIEKSCCWLVPENDRFPPIKVTPENQFEIWGVVTYWIKSAVCSR